ncbi:hypothetical protein [Anaerosphaera multitolerans]|uniref:Uncharacterized protein n=1 Tax=Anaerosphaera multitolerans TaxID=2487351 RepID=A0A437S8P5_9FIRM|nr:hypothetical protein [Anaerosphaera multitolerans]RVU55466.1 hypothetical protein EF514_01690 [Anaerosphaera multitolerans]
MEDYFNRNFPRELLQHATEKVNFGGELNLKKMSFIDRKLVKMAEKLEVREMGISYKNIDKIASEVLDK